jgi:hypothetical protein
MNRLALTVGAKFGGVKQIILLVSPNPSLHSRAFGVGACEDKAANADRYGL